MTIRDIVFNEKAVEDYTNAPTKVQKAIDKVIRLMLDGGNFPRSMRVHSAQSEWNDVYIGYITRKHEHWRVLFEIDDNIVYISRFMSHDDADRYLDQFI